MVSDPTAEINFSGQVLVAAGWKPGFSTDFDAVMLAERYKADTVINLSNIRKVYTDDPKTNPEARPIDAISWKNFRAMVGDEWLPGKNLPFDPIAAEKRRSFFLRVIVASGRETGTVASILKDSPFEGTVIGPE